MADGWRVVYGNYWPREVGSTFKTEAECETWIKRFGGKGDWRIEPFYFDVVEAADQHIYKPEEKK